MVYTSLSLIYKKIQIDQESERTAVTERAQRMAYVRTYAYDEFNLKTSLFTIAFISHACKHVVCEAARRESRDKEEKRREIEGEKTERG